MNTESLVAKRTKLVSKAAKDIIRKSGRNHPPDQNMQIRMEAYQLYMEGYFPRQIVEMLHVPAIRVTHWVNAGWARERKALMAAGKAAIQRTAQQQVVDNLPLVMERQLRIANKMDQTCERILDTLPKKPDAFVVNQTAQAMSKSADIAARVVGLGEQNGLNIRVGVAVHVGVSPLAPEGRQATQQPIDVTPIPTESVAQLVSTNPLPE